MNSAKTYKNFDYQVFDLSVIGTAIKNIHDHLATPMGGFSAGYSAALR